MPDHEVARLSVIHQFCVSSESWLNKDPENIIAVHCKGGKGRTGLMISCLLIHLNQCATATEALEMYSDFGCGRIH